MRVVLAPVGTRGDVQPMLALGIGLRARGHEVTLCAPSNFREWVEGYGLQFVSIGTDFQAALKDYRDGGTAVVLRVGKEIPMQFEGLMEATCNADALVGACFQFAGPSVAELRRIPYFYAIYWPQLIPSTIHAMLGSPWQTPPRWLNSFMIGTIWPAVWNLYFRRKLNRVRAKAGLAPATDVLTHISRSGHALLAFDSEIGPVPLEYASPHTMTGALSLDDKTPLTPETEAFLADGPPPIYIGFGSMPTKDPAGLTKMLADAAVAAGQRALVHSGWAGLGRIDLPRGCRIIGPASHTVLFPRVAAVVHHGGAGTTAAAARAGVPQVVVPHFGDQFYWGHRVHVTGVGPPAIRRRRLTAEKLAAAIRTATTDESTQARARAIGDRLRAKNGVAIAARAIESRVPKPTALDSK